MDDLPIVDLYQEMLEITREMLSASEGGEVEQVSSALARRQTIIETVKGSGDPPGERLSPDERDWLITVLREIASMDETVRENLARNIREETAKAEEARKQMQMLKTIRDAASSATPRFYDKKG